MYCGHEALLLDYERPLLLLDPDAGTRPFSGSAHSLCIGERTRQPDGAHIVFASCWRTRRPEIGPGTMPEQAAEYVERLDPDAEPGPLTLLARMGGAWARTVPPAARRTCHRHWPPADLAGDPMHGNTVEPASGYKTRTVDAVADEVVGFLGGPPGPRHDPGASTWSSPATR